MASVDLSHNFLVVKIHFTKVAYPRQTDGKWKDERTDIKKNKQTLNTGIKTIFFKTLGCKNDTVEFGY